MRQGISIVEYMVLFLIILAAFLVMRGYIQGGLNGTWQKAGMSYGFGRQYDAQKTVDCGFDDISNRWYDRECYRYYAVNNQCGADVDCQEAIIKGTCSANTSCNGIRNEIGY